MVDFIYQRLPEDTRRRMAEYRIFDIRLLEDFKFTCECGRDEIFSEECIKSHIQEGLCFVKYKDCECGNKYKFII